MPLPKYEQIPFKKPTKKPPSYTFGHFLWPIKPHKRLRDFTITQLKDSLRLLIEDPEPIMTTNIHHLNLSDWRYVIQKTITEKQRYEV